MRKFAISMLLVVAFVFAAVPGLAQDGPTVVDVAVGAPDLSTLVAAVQAAGLVDTLNGPGPFTVLAPTNGAFNTALTDLGLTAEQLLADTDLLTTVLTYHVIPGEFKAADLIAAGSIAAPTVQGEAVQVDIVEGKVSLNGGQAIVTIPDVDVSNGVIHIIDNVILPPSITGAATAAPTTTAAAGPTVVGAAASISDFSTLVAAVQAAGLVDTLNGPGPFTVLDPTNGAFNTLLSDLGVTAEQLLADTDLLTAVLTYHVIPGEFKAADLIAAGSLAAPTANGATVQINIVDGKVSLNGGRAIVTIPDIDVSNGVIHVIDNVILPPS